MHISKFIGRKKDPRQQLSSPFPLILISTPKTQTSNPKPRVQVVSEDKKRSFCTNNLNENSVNYTVYTVISTSLCHSEVYYEIPKHTDTHGNSSMEFFPVKSIFNFSIMKSIQETNQYH